jgi:GT2 family glycosyltransferase
MASEDKKSPDVSILICSRDRRKTLEDLCLNLLKMATRFSFEIIVVEETDSPAPIQGVLYVPHPVASRGIPYARNLALAHANGEIIIFLDDDCVIHDRWLDELLVPFQDGSVVGVQGGATVPETSTAIGWAESILGFPGGGIARVLQAKGESQTTKEISTLNCAYRKWVIEKVGGFDENLTFGSEDFLLAKEVCLHGRCLFVPNALIFHEARGTLKKIWQWFVRRGRAEMRLVKLRKLEEINLGSLLKGSISFKTFLVLLAGALFPGFFILIIFIALVLYFVVQLARYFGSWKLCNAPVMTIFLLPLVKLVMDSAMDWGRVRGLLLE